MRWPEDHEVRLVKKNRREVYETPDGFFPRVTSITGMSGLGKEGLMKWSAETERDATIEAAYACRDAPTMALFRQETLQRLPDCRAHVAASRQAADIGSRAHEQASYALRGQTGQERGHEPILRVSERVAFDCWSRWWGNSGLDPVRSEQKVWCPLVGAAGTVDLIASDNGSFGVVDFKFATGIYPEYHMQVAAYVEMVKRWVPVDWAQIVRFAKYEDDPLLQGKGYEVVALGDFSYTTKGGKRVEKHMPFDELLNAFYLLRDFKEIMG